MTLSDLLTVIAIIVAVLAIISEENKELILHKLTRNNWIYIICSLLLIHWLIAFQWFQTKFSFLEVFVISGWPPPEAWAYIITVCLLGFLLYKITYATFPLRNVNKIQNLYSTLILKGEFDKLINVINKYHKEQVLSYLSEIKKIEIELKTEYPEPEGYSEKLINRQKKQIERENLRSARYGKREFRYGNMVFFNCFLNDRFLTHAANTDPYLFTDAISNISLNRLREPNFVNLYLRSLLLNNNELFVRELKHIKTFDLSHDLILTDKTPILKSLIDNIHVAIINEAWKSIGNLALEEIDNEMRNPKSILRLKYTGHTHNNDEVWDLTIKKSVVFFDIMVRKSISNQCDNPMFMMYYKDFILKLSSSSFTYSMPKGSRADILINDMICNILNWAELMVYHSNIKFSETFFMLIEEVIKILLTNKYFDSDKYYNRIWHGFSDLYGDNKNEIRLSLQNQFVNRVSNLVQIIKCETSINNKTVLSKINSHWINRDRHRLSAPMYTAFLSNYEEQVVRYLNSNFDEDVN